MFRAEGNEAKRLIVNADDLALHPSVNRAIFRAHREGIVTSTTILAGGAAFSEAVEESKCHPELGIGLHLCLVDQAPVSDPGKIPSLVEPNGRLAANYSVFLRKYAFGKIRTEEIKLELEAQVAKAIDFGLTPTHLDSHQHLHILPGIARQVKEIGRRFGVTRIRIPTEDVHISGSPILSMRGLQGRVVNKLAHFCRKRFMQSGWASPDHFFGFMRSGRMLKQDWRELIPLLLPGITEVMVHPGEDDLTLKSRTGWEYSWEGERSALVDPDVRAMLQEHNIELINFGDLC